MKNKILIISLILLTFSACEKDDIVTEEEKTYTTIKGNTYVAKSPASWESGVYIIYKMSNDSTIDIEERMYSSDGKLKDKMKGFFKYSHPNLELKVQSISGCENCFNYFTATVADDRKSFKYTIWDMMVSKDKTIEFKIKE
jgi:hypothetical protein